MKQKIKCKQFYLLKPFRSSNRKDGATCAAHTPGDQTLTKRTEGRKISETKILINLYLLFKTLTTDD